jgi:hypothetical protein
MKKFLLVLALLLPALAAAQVPLQIHYQGYLTGSTGAPVNAPTDIVLLLYATQAAQKPLWAESHAAVPVSNGHFSVMLGSIEPLSLSVFDTARWLAVQAAGDAEMTPRQMLGTAPFAAIAQQANTLAGTATVQGSQIAGAIAGSQVTGTIAGATIGGATLSALGGHFVAAVGNTITTLDAAGNVGEYSSLAIGADGLPVISYHARPVLGAAGRLKVAKCGNAACTTGTISVVDPGVYDPNGPLSVVGAGQHTSIAIDTNGYPVIAYFDAANLDLKVAACLNAACTGTSTLTTVDSAGNVGWYTSIAVGADGLPVISYVDQDNLRLKVAKCVNADCTGGATITELDVIDAAGEGTSVKVSADGLPVISYVRELSFRLKVVKCGQADCRENNTITALDTTSGVGRFNSIALGNEDYPVISYQGLGGLKVVQCFDPACSQALKVPPTMVDVSTGVQYTSIAVGQGGLPVIAYYDETSLDLKVAKCATSSCTETSQITAVDSAGDVGQYASMAIGTDGNPVIAYYDATNGDLKVVKCVNQTCAVWQ